MGFLEIFIYYLEHSFASFLGPVFLSLAGRYEMASYMKFPLPWFGFILFSLYMRYVLTPLAYLTWANLNHSLCDVDNDPWYKYLDLGESYYLFADFYLLLTCMFCNLLNIIIVTITLKLVNCYRPKLLIVE